MTRFPTIRTMTVAALLAAATNPAQALMARPELGGMGMTGYLSAIMSECPRTPLQVAIDKKWRPGQPCPEGWPVDQPTDPKATPTEGSDDTGKAGKD